MKLSSAATNLLEERIGYRNEGLSAGTFTIKQILEFETKELGNDDILETCQKLYGTNDVLKIIENKFGHLGVYGVWFARKEDILEYYAEDGETEVTMYRIPDNHLLLSDLADEGVLIAFKERPDGLYIDSEIIQGTTRLSLG
ncbi:hypothetical protein CN918_28400 [Priestia megaterium]|nr:hypothetical protein CN918_28400 [Priestia megaterium]